MKLREMVEEARFNVWYEKNQDRRAFLVVELLRIMFWPVKIWLCGHFGHKWEDRSTAGPDSGNVHMICNRCGDEHYHALY